MKEEDEVSDESKIDSFIEKAYIARPDTKLQRIAKTYLINFSFIALVRE